MFTRYTLLWQLDAEALVTNHGSMTHSGARRWFVARHDGSPPSDFGAFGQHGGLTLGSWHDGWPLYRYVDEVLKCKLPSQVVYFTIPTLTLITARSI